VLIATNTTDESDLIGEAYRSHVLAVQSLCCGACLIRTLPTGANKSQRAIDSLTRTRDRTQLNVDICVGTAEHYDGSIHGGLRKLYIACCLSRLA
jgi:hypothetical protein